MRQIFYLIAFACLATAATITGTAFDSSLEPTTALIHVNTTPSQTIVAKNGSYSFEAPAGFYRIIAFSPENYSTQVQIEVNTQGTYKVDLILFTKDIDIGSSELNELNQLATENEIEAPSASDREFPLIPLLAAIAICAAAGVYLYTRWKGKEKQAQIPALPPAETNHAKHAEENRGEHEIIATQVVQTSQSLTKDQERVLHEIQKSNGRITQKELRKVLADWSEAKVSMEVTELEEKGAITKLKKGRGNVLRTR